MYLNKSLNTVYKSNINIKIFEHKKLNGSSYYFLRYYFIYEYVLLRIIRLIRFCDNIKPKEISAKMK